MNQSILENKEAKVEETKAEEVKEEKTEEQFLNLQRKNDKNSY